MFIFKRSKQLMKYLVVIILLFITQICYSQTFINRAGAANTVIDQRLGAAQNFFLPRLNDTTLSGGLDSIGNLIYDRLRGKIAIRDTVLTGGHKFTFLFKQDDTITTLATQFDISQLGVTADNGLTKTGSTIQLGGTLLQSTTISTTASYFLNVTGANVGQSLKGTNTTTGTGVMGQSTSGTGVYGLSSSLNGVLGVSTSGTGVVGESTSGEAINANLIPSSTNTLAPVVRIQRFSSGTAANGIGGSLDWYTQSTGGSTQRSNRIGSSWSNATTGSRTSILEFYGVNSTTEARKAALAGDGQWTWDGYPALTAQVDSTTYKPVAINMTTGAVVPFGGWSGGGGGATLNNIGTGFAWAATPGGNIKRVANGYGVLWDSTGTANSLTAKSDTSTLKDVYLPIHLDASKTIDQNGFDLYFTGSGQDIFDSTKHTQTYLSPTLLADSLVTFGNSITVGSNATIPDSAYVNRTASYYGLPLTNKGVSSTVAYQACASNLAYINPGHTAMTTFCIGLNDYRNNGGAATMHRGVKNAYEAAMVNQFLASYVPASDGAVTRYGSWTTNYNAATNSGGKTTTAAYSSTTDDSLTTDITGTSVALGVIGLFGSLKDCIVYIDGVIVDSFSTSAQTANTGTTYQSMGKYYTGLSNGVHHVKVKVGPGSNFLLIDYIGTLVPSASMQPFVFVHVPHMDATGYAGGLATQAIIDAGNDSLTAAYNRALAAGLNVYLAQTNSYYNASTSSGLSSDHIHPNDLGMYQIFTAIRLGISSATATNGTLRYSNDGHFYGAKIDGSLNQIPYAQDLTFQRVLTNGSNLTNPNYISGNNSLDWVGFSRFRVNDLFIDNSHNALMHGTLGVQGALGGVTIGNRNGDTTEGFLLYTTSNYLRVFDTYNNNDAIIIDTSLRTLFINDKTYSPLSVPSATIHIGGNTLGRVGHPSLKIDSGLLVSSPEKYAIEVDGDSIYWTNRLLQRVALNRVGAGATTLYNGDGTLAGDRNVASGGFTLRLSGVNNSDTLMSIINTGTSSTALFANGTLFGVDAQSTNVGLRAFGTSTGALLTGDTDEGAVIKSNTIRGVTIQSVPASTNTVQEVARFERGSTGGPGANGIGGSGDFYNKLSDNSSNVSNQLISKWTNATVGSRTSQFKITGVNSTTTGDILTIDGDGSFTTYGKRIIGTTTSAAGTLTLGNSEAYIFNGTTTTWTLPAVSGTTGTIYYVKNIGSGSITLNAAAAANEIYSTSAVNTYEITAGSAIILISNGTYFTVN
jgi:hypothetical protein